MTIAWFYAGLIALAPPADPTPADLTQSYQEARAKAGRSSEDQVRLALWCEAHGLTAERLNHLTLAILADPKNATARGLMGLVFRDGRWSRPEVLAEKAKPDANLAEYEAKRLKTPYTAEGQYALGVWAEEHGLKDQAKAHLTAVTRLAPAREDAWKRLGYKKHAGRWMTDAQMAAEKTEAEAQKVADRKWKPFLEKYKAMLDQPSRREEAEAALLTVTDPRAVPMIGKVFAMTVATQVHAARMLGQVDAPGASKALAFLSMFARSPEARRVSAETLRGRDAREYADLLIMLIRDPIKYEIRPSNGPGSLNVLHIEGPKNNLDRIYESGSAFQPGDTIGIDRFGQPVLRHTLFADSNARGPIKPARYSGSAYATDDYYSAGTTAFGSMAPALGMGQTLAVGPQQVPSPSTANPAALPDALRPFLDGNLSGHGTQPNHHPAASLGGIGAARPPSQRFRGGVDYTTSSVAEVPLAVAVSESEKSAAFARQKLQADVEAIDRLNRSIRDSNDRVVTILNDVTGHKLPPDRKTWDRWWVDQLGYALVTDQTATNPTVVEVVSGYQPQITPSNVINQTSAFRRIDCFGAGTLIRTIDGTRPIESLQAGDRVLTQSTVTGALGYRPILTVHRNPPSSTFRIKLAGDEILSSHFHRFWVAGRGWVMARDLKAGDSVRTLGGVMTIESVEMAGADKLEPVYNLDVAEDADFFAGKAAALVHDNTLPDPRLAPFDAALASTAAPKDAPLVK